jgi:hypothetical protein
MRILFLAANPSKTSRLDLEEELRSLEDELRGVKFRDSIALIARHAVRPDDLVRFVRAENPNVIHFSGHGSTAGIILRDDDGGFKAIAGVTLRRFLTGRGVDLVVLNACYSKDQADAVLGAVNTVIGTTDAVEDEAARRFTVAFYRSLGDGLPVREAFRDGGDAVALHGLNDVFHGGGDLDLVLVSMAKTSSSPPTTVNSLNTERNYVSREPARPTIPSEVLNASKLLVSVNAGERNSGVRALAGIDLSAATEMLVEALQNGYRDVRTLAAVELGKRKDPRAIPELARVIAFSETQRSTLSDPTPSEIVGLLENIGPDSIATLCVASNDSRAFVREAVIKTLGRLRNQAAVPCLLTALKDDDTTVRGVAADALANVKSNDPTVVAALIEMLSDYSEITHDSMRRLRLPFMSDTACLALLELNSEQAKAAAETYRATRPARLKRHLQLSAGDEISSSGERNSYDQDDDTKAGVEAPRTGPAPPSPPPNPKSVGNNDIQKNRWGGKSKGYGRRLFVTVDKYQDHFEFQAILESTDGTPLQTPIFFHLHDSYRPSRIRLFKTLYHGKRAILERRAEGTFTIGVQFRDAAGTWRSLEYDLAGYSNRTLTKYD